MPLAPRGIADASLLELRRSQRNLAPWAVRSLQVPRVDIVFAKATTVWCTLWMMLRGS